MTPSTDALAPLEARIVERPTKNIPITIIDIDK